MEKRQANFEEYFMFDDNENEIVVAKKLKMRRINHEVGDFVTDMLPKNPKDYYYVINSSSEGDTLIDWAKIEQFV